jgi:hypothetical protein
MTTEPGNGAAARGPKSKPWCQTLAVVVVVLLLAMFVFKVSPFRGSTSGPSTSSATTSSSDFAACIRDALIARKEEESTRAAQIGNAFEAVRTLGLSNKEKATIVQQTYEKQTQLDIVSGCARAAHADIPFYPVVSVTDPTGLSLNEVSISAGQFESCSTGSLSGGICRLLVATQTASSGVHFRLEKPRYRSAPDSASHAFTTAEIQGGTISLHMIPLAHRATITVTVASQPQGRIAVTPRSTAAYFSDACELAGKDRQDPGCLTAETDGDGKVTFYITDESAAPSAAATFGSVELLFAGLRRVCQLDLMLSTDWAACAPRVVPQPPAGAAPNCGEVAVFRTLLTNVNPPPDGKKVKVSVTLDAKGTVTAVVPPDVGQNLIGKRVGSVGPCTYTFDAASR